MSSFGVFVYPSMAFSCSLVGSSVYPAVMFVKSATKLIDEYHVLQRCQLVEYIVTVWMWIQTVKRIFLVI